MIHRHYKKFILVGFLISATASLYILFGDPPLQPRPELKLDFADLTKARTGPEVLDNLKGLGLQCRVGDTALGRQMCVAELAKYEGLPANSIVFYFDGQQQLTAVKLSLPADQHGALTDLFTRRYGAPGDRAAIATWRVAEGRLALGAPENDLTTSLWLAETPAS